MIAGGVGVMGWVWCLASTQLVCLNWIIIFRPVENSKAVVLNAKDPQIDMHSADPRLKILSREMF